MTAILLFYATWTCVALAYGGALFLLAARSGQWEDLEGPKYVMFHQHEGIVGEGSPLGGGRTAAWAALLATAGFCLLLAWGAWAAWHSL